MLPRDWWRIGRGPCHLLILHQFRHQLQRAAFCRSSWLRVHLSLLRSVRSLLHARRNTHEHIWQVMEAKMLTKVERVAFAKRKLIRSRPLLGYEKNVFVSLM